MGSEAFIIPIIFGFFAFILYTFLNSRHKERMALIDSGRDAGLFKGGSDPQYMGALKWGLILVCLGVGAGLGSYFDINGNHDGPFVTIPMLFGSGGVGLLIYYTIAKNVAKEE